MTVPLALYVHVPWCVRKCPYCDFNSHQLNAATPDPHYIDTLIADFELEAPFIAGRPIETVFFGGGTPSLFAPRDIARLLEALRSRVVFAADAEITLEANPGTIERGRFSGYAQAGINRISLGAQSFSPQALRLLGRIHSAEDTARAVAELRAAQLDNFNLDLMYGLPEQSLDAARADVETAIALAPAHISYYQLTLEPGTVFHARPPALPDDDVTWSMQEAGQALLARAGYEQYEVSAYARRGARCRHNLNYWSFGDYVGIGAGAHGKVTLAAPARIVRTVKAKQPREYQSQVWKGRCGERSTVAPADLPFEYMLNALRLNEGFSVEHYAAMTGLDPASMATGVAQAVKRGLLDKSQGGWQPSALGRRFLNDLQGGFLA